MALEQVGASLGNGTAFLVAGGIVYEIVAANCSSPQTTELNAVARADTLMKWVHLGAGQAVLFLAAAMIIDSNHRVAIAAGGGLAIVLMYVLYIHAKNSGLANTLPGTEQYNGSKVTRWA
jgi:hypothetical protein